MKKLLFAVLLAGFAAGFMTPVSAAEMSKKEAAEYLQKVMREKVQEAAKERLEKELTKIAPGATALYKRLAGIIAAEQLAASLCWDLINLGLQNNEKKFAAEFAKSMRKYIPQEYTMGADAVNSFTEDWGFHVVTEQDCVTVLYELGKNTFAGCVSLTELILPQSYLTQCMPHFPERLTSLSLIRQDVFITRRISWMSSQRSAV